VQEVSVISSEAYKKQGIAMKIKFQTLLPWMGEILGSIKKDIKNDFLPSNPIFCRSHFGNLPQSRITIEDICTAFSKELLAGNEEIADWVINRWLYKRGDLYQHFADRLFEVNPDFDQIKELSLEESQKVLAGAKESFGAKEIFFFSVLNGVVFPESVLAQLRDDAEAETAQLIADEKAAAEEKERVKALIKEQKEAARALRKQNLLKR